ncbi:hypothetical protein AAU61_10160 [Desulfocarbo indianensis]|nr:hypothetical protein AAU61_10160 [Desulfocarbo indianensis]
MPNFKAGQEAKRSLTMAGNGFVLDHLRWKEGPCRMQYLNGPGKLSISAELPRLVGPGNAMPPWTYQRQALGKLRGVWREQGGQEEPRVSRLDAALDLPYPDHLWPRLRASLAALEPARHEFHHQAELVSWSQNQGRHVKVYHRGEHLIRLEVTMKNSHSQRSSIPDGILEGLTLQDLEEHGPEICRAALLRAADLLGIRVLGLQDIEGFAERLLSDGSLKPAQALGVLGWIVAEKTLGRRALRKSLAESSYHYWRNLHSRIAPPEEGSPGELADQVSRALAPPASFISSRLADVAAASMAELREVLGKPGHAEAPPRELEPGESVEPLAGRWFTYAFAFEGEEFRTVTNDIRHARAKRDAWLNARREAGNKSLDQADGL